MFGAIRTAREGRVLRTAASPDDLWRRAIAAQPEWLAQVPTERRLPDGALLVFTGSGTSFHAARMQTGVRMRASRIMVSAIPSTPTA